MKWFWTLILLFNAEVAKIFLWRSFVRVGNAFENVEFEYLFLKDLLELFVFLNFLFLFFFLLLIFIISSILFLFILLLLLLNTERRVITSELTSLKKAFPRGKEGWDLGKGVRRGLSEDAFEGLRRLSDWWWWLGLLHKQIWCVKEGSWLVGL